MKIRVLKIKIFKFLCSGFHRARDCAFSCVVAESIQRSNLGVQIEGCSLGANKWANSWSNQKESNVKSIEPNKRLQRCACFFDGTTHGPNTCGR